MPDTLTPKARDLYRHADMVDGPLYGEIELTRFADSMIVTCAPTVALINPEFLFQDRAKIRVRNRTLIELSDQVEYRITGFDRERGALIVLLERDLR